MKAKRVDWTPTAAQLELIEAKGTRFVEACPGSGKTSAIVARYERSVASEQRRGVALLSFTNAAVDEVVGRCKDSRAVAAPNFVGTFDGFINRYLSGPWLANRLGRQPQFIDTWESIRAARFSFSGLSEGIHFSLDHFDWDDLDRYRFIPGRTSGQWANALRVAYNKDPEDIDRRAAELRKRLIGEHGIVSSSASRHLALQVLRSNRREVWLRLLAGRFAEFIVDEAQDCGVEELAVLDLAAEAGITVVAVADLDQSIFEFRRADPSKVAAFANRIGRGTRLDGNFRSSPAIVGLGRRLRASSTPDYSVGPEKNNEIPVEVLAFQSAQEVAPAVALVLARMGLPEESCVVLSHRRDQAAECAGAPISTNPSQRNVTAIAAAHTSILNDPNPLRRRKSLQDVERIVVHLAVETAAKHHTVQSLAEEIGLSDRWVRDAATRLIYGADPYKGREEYTAAVRALVRGLPWPADISLPHLGQRLATPPQSDWSKLTMSAAASASLTWNTIHGAKGRQYDAVVVVIPQRLPCDDNGNTCLDLWEKGINGESRRVLYVGVTRARKAVIIAVHQEHYERVLALVS